MDERRHDLRLPSGSYPRERSRRSRRQTRAAGLPGASAADRSRLAVAGWLALALAAPAAARAGSGACTVPGTHATVQAAVLDLGCTTIDLAAGSYPDPVVIARSLDLAGPDVGVATLEGGLTVAGAATVVDLTDLLLDTTAGSAAGCAPRALLVRDGARTTARSVNVRATANTSCLFRDDFESATTSRWSVEVP